MKRLSIFAERRYMRHMTRAQRRAWWPQRWKSAPKVLIGIDHLPPTVRRSFAYVNLGTK